MATIDKKGNITGVVGPVIYRVLNGKNIIQSKSSRDRRTDATKKAAKDFGRSSRTSRQIRKALEPVTAGFETAYMPSRLSGLVYKATKASSGGIDGKRNFSDGNLSLLEHFQFNTASPFEQYCSIIPEFTLETDNRLTISFAGGNTPEMLAAVPAAAEAELCIFVTVIEPAAAASDAVYPYLHSELFRTTFNLKQPEISPHTWSTAPLPKEKLVIIASALFYFRKHNLIGSVAMNGKALHPCEITAVIRS